MIESKLFCTWWFLALFLSLLKINLIIRFLWNNMFKKLKVLYTVSVTARWSDRIIWPWRTFRAFSLRELSSKQGKAKRARGARESGTFLLPFLVSVKPHHHQRDFYSQFYFWRLQLKAEKVTTEKNTE